MAIEVDSSRFAPIYKNRGLARFEQKKSNIAKEDFKMYIKQMPEAQDKISIEQAISQM